MSAPANDGRKSDGAGGVKRLAGIAVFGIALVVLIVAAFLSPRRAAAAYLVAYVATVSVALGALALVMIAHASGANWFVLLRRQAEHALAALPALAVLALPLLAMLPVLYPWAVPRASMSADMIGVLRSKGAYLNVPFFIVRTVVYWVAWIALGESLRRASLAQDRGDAGSAGATGRMRTISAAGLPIFAITMTFASFDWMMSLTPKWQSTIYGVYWFAGGFVGALALVAVLGEAARRSGRIETLKDDHFHALGTLLFTFIMFWAYMAYSQLLVIWIANIPREVTWYVSRFYGGWGWLGLAIAIGHLAIPFLALLMKAVKRNGMAMALLGIWLLAMHYIDTYWIVQPLGDSFGWLDVVLAAAALAVVAGIAAGSAVWRTRGESPVPLADPVLDESLHYQTS